jgi:dihydrofolate reductase
MEIILVAAIAKNGVIGKDHKLPWHLPRDLEHFYKLIRSHPVIIGRKSFEAIGHPIKTLKTIVLSHQPNLKIPDSVVVDSVANALRAAEQFTEVLVIGGEMVYREFLPFATKMILTLIDANFVGDSFFPKWDQSEWIEMARQNFTAAAENPYNFSIVTLERKLVAS